MERGTWRINVCVLCVCVSVCPLSMCKFMQDVWLFQ